MKEIDPRIYGIKKKLSPIEVSVPVLSNKGGVGKSTISVALALSLRELGLKVGLIDLDLANPSTHIILGIDQRELSFPEEEEGVKPKSFENISFFSPVLFVKEKALAMRGKDLDSAIKEMLAIINWGKLDVLVADTPPGLSDAFFNVLELLPNRKTLVLSGCEKLSKTSVSRMIDLLVSMNEEPFAVIYNMCLAPEQNGIPLKFKAYTIPFDPKVQSSIGEPARLRKTLLYDEVKKVANHLASSLRNRC